MSRLQLKCSSLWSMIVVMLTTRQETKVKTSSTKRIHTRIAQVRRQMAQASGDAYSLLSREYDRLQELDSYGYKFLSDAPNIVQI
jgi:hypothetical protein